METYFRNEHSTLTVVDREMITAEELQELQNYDDGEINVHDEDALFVFVESTGEYLRFDRNDVVHLELETIAEYLDTEAVKEYKLCKDSAGNFYIKKFTMYSKHFAIIVKTSLKEIMRDYEFFTDAAVASI